MVSQDENYKKQIAKILSDSRICNANRMTLTKYDTHGKFQQLTFGTRSQRLGTLRQLALSVRKDFKNMNKEDIENYFSSLGELQPKTWSTKGAFVKSFFKWLFDLDEYPPNVKWINTSVKSKNRKLPSDLLTKAEIKALADATDNLSDRALITVLYESACRIGEMLNLRIKDVSNDQYGSILIVNGKTGMRRIRIIESSPDLVLWMNNHPEKQNRESPLFIYLANKNRHQVYGKGLDHQAIKRIMSRIVKRAKINKRVHPHLFRHSRLTELAKDFSESELKVIAGWTGSSTMAEVYVHLSGADIERKLLEKSGLLDKKADETSDNETLKPKKCPRCNEINPNTAKFCYACSMSLDMKAIFDVDKRENTELQPDGALKGLISYIIKMHPELVIEFLKENGADPAHILSSYSKITNSTSQPAFAGIEVNP